MFANLPFQLALLCSLQATALAHNWLLNPQPRITGEAGLYGASRSQQDNCENSDTNVPGQNNYQRGQSVDASWVYNNHYGGFVRFSLVPLGQEGDKDAMNDPANFISISCMSRNCGGRTQGYSDSQYDYLSPYNLPAQSGVPFDNSNPENACSTSLTIPSYIEDGTFVLQWVMYGTHDSDGDKDKALPFYRNCANIQVSGGSQLTDKPQGQCNFAWTGGDRTLSNIGNVNDIGKDDLELGKCSYWKFNSISSDTNYYDPPGLFTDDGGQVSDSSALRAGPPAEVEACNGQVPSGSSGSSSSSDDSSSGTSTSPNNGAPSASASSKEWRKQCRARNAKRQAKRALRARAYHGRKRL